ncbi:MAG: alanine racemase [Solobacterium sp.]|jgi:diaminopimelate decarboxylase|nr:alanine racemase [Solobacterium sp.]MCH4049756.1 alanine racemase [Solobacterium sp.]MCH4073441.1 alanine racemase [Solobacterium sp.]MCI1313419.1 alanine racemase [Solobacterium sp.]MCI1345677.1 alanine racemase [Solobacterium sp.]
MNAQELRQIADQYHTPCYVFDLESLKARMDAVKQLAQGHYRLCFSMKANPFLAADASEGLDQVEVCSPGELAICRRQKIAPEKILYSGVNKGEADIKDAVRRGAALLTAESLWQVQMIEAEGRKQNKEIPILLRLTSGNQFGMDLSDVYQVLSHRADYPHLRIEGLHYFAGTQRTMKSQKKDLEMLAALYAKIRTQYGTAFRKLEYGPGLQAYLFAREDRSDTLKPLKDIHAYLCDLAQMSELTVECGRFMSAYCGYYLISAADCKTSEGTSYCIVDGGMHQVHYDGSLMGMNAPEVIFLDESDGQERDWCVCGSLCTVNDVLIRRLHARLKIGDRMAFANAGAYAVTEGMSLFLSRDLPSVILRRQEGDWQLVRSSEDTGIWNTGKGR